jgi:hypothetical protein
MQILTNEVNFGKVLLNSKITPLSFQNLGNDLEITGSSDIYPFKIEDKFPIIISKNSQNLAISLETSSKYSSSKALSL